ncbi:MAG: DUF1440 domain-containing protein [Chloroflexota bacterium]|nr:DUF1440 domain-containing protein [Chloroflexota bacterium]
MELRKELVAGIAGGLAGGTAMLISMAIGKKIGMIEEPLPLKIERDLEKRAHVDHKTNARQEKALAYGEHYLLSAIFGAGYGLLHWATRVSPMPSGQLYGLGVFVLNLVGIGPALNLTPVPWEQKPSTVIRRAMMHSSFGTVTAIVAEKIRGFLAQEDNRILMRRTAESS